MTGYQKAKPGANGKTAIPGVKAGPAKHDAGSMRASLRASGLAYRRLLLRLRNNEIVLTAIAAAIGFAVGFGVWIMNGAVVWLHYILFGVPVSGHLSSEPAVQSLNSFLGPAIGGAFVGILSAIIRWLRPREIVDAIEANALYGGRMSLIDSLNLGLLTIVAVGFGGSAGLEAAYTQVGSGMASKAGQNLRLRREDLRLLVGCGSAAAISAAFNSPLAGAFYAFELIIGSYTLQALAPVASAAVSGNLAMLAVSENQPMFVLRDPAPLQSHDYFLFIALGLGAAAVSIAAMRTVTIVENSLRHRKVPGWLRPIIGGTAVGAIATSYPEVLGSGHGAISSLLAGGFVMQPLIALMVAKIGASALTVGSGMRGGLFSSSLFLGAVFGGAVAAALQAFFPLLTISPMAYAVAGMGAIAAGIVGAPVTMTLLVLETTGNLSLTIGVLAAVIACTVVVRQSFGYSFATWRFHVRGLRIKGAHDIGWIADLSAGRLMRRDIHCVPSGETVRELRRSFPLGGPKYAFVLDEHGTYLGTIDTIEAHSTAYDDTSDVTKASDLIHEEPRVLTPDTNIHDALLAFTKTSLEVLPVAESSETRRVIGFVSEAYLLRRYSQQLEKHRIEETNGGVFSPKGPAF